MSEVVRERQGTPWWLVLGIFVALPVTVSFVISRQAAAQQLRRKAIASSHGWAIENKNEGQRAFIVRGFHRDVEFEAVSLLREGGGAAWRVRFGVPRQFTGWTLVRFGAEPWRANDFGTISTLVTREVLPPVVSTPAELGAAVVHATPESLALSPSMLRALANPPRELAVSFADDAVVLDGTGPLPEGEALLPVLDFAVSVVSQVVADAG